MILEAFKAPLQQLCLHKSAVMVQTQTSEMFENKLMPPEQGQDDAGSLKNSNTATLPAWERRDGLTVNKIWVGGAEKLFESIGHTSKSEIPRFKNPEAHHQMSDLTYKCPN